MPSPDAIAALAALVVSLVLRAAGLLAPAPPADPARPVFHVAVAPLSPAAIAAMRSEAGGPTWQPGCPVPLEDLRSLTLRHWTPDGGLADGTLVVHRDAVTAVARAFGRLFTLRFPIERMVPVEAYGGDDDASTLANNTSGFNCRPVDGSSRWSQHAYGRAVDINPLWNPWVRADGTVKLEPSAPFVDRTRSDVPGMLTPGSPAVAAFTVEGWGWGGDWRRSKDWQHVSANGR